MFGDPELYGKAFPDSFEAEQFWANKYDLTIFTPAILHSDYVPRSTTTPTYAQAAGSGQGERKKKRKGASATELARDGDTEAKTPSPLPQASRRFFVPRSNPATHTLAQRIAPSFPDIAAATLRDSKCLLLKGFIAKVNNRVGVSLTSSNPNPPAESYARYFDALSRHLNQSFPSEIIHGLRLPKRQQLYSWQFTQSGQTSALTTTSNSLRSSKTPFTTPKRSRSAQPGTLTRTELLGSPSRPLRWLSPLTSTTFPSSSPPSSSSQSGSRSKRRRKLTATPNALTATVSDRPTSDAPRSTQLVSIPHYTILAQHTAVRTPPARKAETPKLFQAAAPPPLPTARTVATTTTPFLGNARRDLSPHLNLRPPHRVTKNYPTPPPILRKAWMWPTMAAPHPILPMPLQPIDLPAPRPLQQSRDARVAPSGSQPAPTRRGLPQVTPTHPAGSARK